MPVHRASKELGVAYNTAYKIYRKLRLAIYLYHFVSKGDTALSGEGEADESYFGGKKQGKRGRGAERKIPVFGILARQGKVKGEIVDDVSGETILRETIKKVKRGSFIYTNKRRSYDGIVMYGFRHECVEKSIRFVNGKVYINSIEGFWSYAKE